MDVECLLREHRYDHRCIVWHLRRALAVDDLPCHDQRAIPPFRDDDPKLSEQTSDHVYQLRSLPDEQTATTMQRQRCLRSEEHTSELQSLMRISYAVFCLKKKTHTN